MWPAVQDARLPPAIVITFQAIFVPYLAWRAVRANTSEQISDWFWIAHRAKDGLDAGSAERRKELLQIHSQYNALSRVRSRERLNRASLYKTVCRRVRRDFVENSRQNLLLE